MLPYFYLSSFDPSAKELVLDEDNSRHVVQVLRMKPDESLQLTDGKGHLLTAVIIDDHKKKCRVRIESMTHTPPGEKAITIAISPLKNASRLEWFLEKATEIGVSAIIPLLSERTERQQIRTDRLQNILVSALLQSQQTWLPVLHAPTTFQQLMENAPGGAVPGRLIAHCLEAPRPTLALPEWIQQNKAGTFPPTIILIGPEGDFSAKEVEKALSEGYTPVTLGENRLRTETAGIVAASLLCIH